MMEYVTKKPICVSLPGMEIYLTSCFFQRLADRPPWRHAHPCYEMICTQLNGKASFTIIPPLKEHISKSLEEGIQCSFLFTFTNSDTNDFCQILRSIDKMVEFQDTFDGITRLIAIREALIQKNFGYEEQLKAELRLFFVQMARNFHTEVQSSYEYSQNLDAQRIALLEDFFNIEMRFPHCNKQQLADKIGVCERQLTRILKETYNSSFSAILLDSRMNMAQAMLEDGEKSISEISESVGYTSTSSFRTAYKKFFGEYPKRKQDIKQ